MAFAQTMKDLALPLSLAFAGMDRSGRNLTPQVMQSYAMGNQIAQQQDTSKAMQIMLQNDDPRAAAQEIQNQGLRVNPQALGMIWNTAQQQKAAQSQYGRDVNKMVLGEQLRRGRPYTLSPGQTRMGPGGKLASMPQTPPTSVREFREARSDPEYARFLESQKSGMAVDVGPDGVVSFRQGPGAQRVGGMTRTVRGNVQKDLLEANETLRRVTEIGSKFQPQFQTYAGKLDMEILGQKAKLGQQLTPQEVQQLQQFSDARAAAFELLNSELNRLSGAAVSEHEMKRLTKNLPSPGTGFFDGDDPVTFQSKLNRIQKQIKMAVARLNYINKHGLTPIQAVPSGKDHPISLERVPGLIDQRGKQIERQLVGQGLSHAEAKQRALQMVADEFGIRF